MARMAPRNGVDIGRIVQVLIRGKQLRQFLQTLVGKGLAQLRILRNRTQTVAAQNALKIKSGTSTHHDFFFRANECRYMPRESRAGIQTDCISFLAQRYQ